ncbi:hypothetical protein [Paraherbaspirillum soli]|uniref:Uncharacterized protein n=1 Tax=Paraherbaspirillum soli TaxID=631222 RepID=A0ABW0MBX5_9BURK
MKTNKTQQKISMMFSFMRCFNVAAITALAVWNGYLFYLKPAPTVTVELIAIASTGASK